jgi:hypothetical protein
MPFYRRGGLPALIVFKTLSILFTGCQILIYLQHHRSHLRLSLASSPLQSWLHVQHGLQTQLLSSGPGHSIFPSTDMNSDTPTLFLVTFSKTLRSGSANLMESLVQYPTTQLFCHLRTGRCVLLRFLVHLLSLRYSNVSPPVHLHLARF